MASSMRSKATVIHGDDNRVEVGILGVVPVSLRIAVKVDEDVGHVAGPLVVSAGNEDLPRGSC